MKRHEHLATSFTLFRVSNCCISIFWVLLVLFTVDLYALTTPPGAGLRYDNGTVTEDITWRGTVTIHGSLTIAPQATVRIEPGTRVQMVAASKRHLSRLVVMGRIQALGSPENPIVFTSETGRWGGILLLSSMKKNQFEYCRIEKVERGIEARFSSISTVKVQISHATTGFALFDSIASSTSDIITHCGTAYSSTASEVEMRNSTFTDNQYALTLLNSSAVISGTVIRKNSINGISIIKSRLTMVSCTVSENTIGLDSQSGEGEIRLCRFSANRVAGLKLIDSPLKISRSHIVDNPGDGIQLHDARPTLWGNALHSNGHASLYYSGGDSFSAANNWWGSSDERALAKVVSASSPGTVMISPWLMERPQLP